MRRDVQNSPIHIVKSASRSLRIALVLVVLAAGFATHAYATINNDAFVAPPGTYGLDQPLNGANQQAFYTAGIKGIDPAKIGENKYKLQYGVNFRSLMTTETEFSTAFVMRFPDGITVDSFEVEAAPGSPEMPRQNVFFIYDNATKWETVALTPAMRQDLARFNSSKTLRVNADGGNSYRPPLLMGTLPSGASFAYQITLEATITSAYARTSNQPCYGSSNFSENHGLVMGTATGFGATPSGPNPGGAIANIFSNIHGTCKQVPESVPAPVATTSPAVESTIATQPQATQATTPPTIATQPQVPQVTTPPTIATQPQVPQVTTQVPQEVPKMTNPGKIPQAHLGTNPVSESTLDQTPAGSENKPDAQGSQGLEVVPRAESPGVESIPDENQSIVESILGGQSTEDSGSYSPHVDPASPDADEVSTSGSADVISSLVDNNSVPSGSSSRTLEYSIAGVLMLCALGALIAHKRYGSPGTEYVSGPRIRLSPSGTQHASDPRLYNSNIQFVDLEVPEHEREHELVGAASISPAAKRARRVLDPTIDVRQSLTSRIWNELTNRHTTKVPVKR